MSISAAVERATAPVHRGVAPKQGRLKEFAPVDVSGNELVTVLRSVALSLDESTRMLVRITDFHDEAAGMQRQLAEALSDLEGILARLEESEPPTNR
jgi:hypothetical protein